MHNKIMKNYLIYYFYLFFLGGQAYCTIEMLWRGRTHYSMFFAGGIVFIFLVYLQHEMKSAHVIEKCLLGSVFITATEFIFGCVFNLQYGMAVWDYNNLPGNVLGQICLPYTGLWFLLCFVLFKWVIKNNLHGRFIGISV